MNLYPDPGLTSSDYTIAGGITRSGSTVSLNGGGSGDIFTTTNGSALAQQVTDIIARHGEYYLSVHVANFVADGATGRLRNGSAALGITADGWSTPVLLTAGVNNIGFAVRGDGGQFDIEPDPSTISLQFPNGEAVRITT